METNEGINVLSLFDGISCGQIALERAGIKVNKYFASEIDKHAIKVTQHNYPNTIQIGDVQNVKTENLPKIDLIMGGFCCQSFSLAGKQLNFNDPRGKLFFECVRLLKGSFFKNPNVYFLFENVRMKKEYEDIISKEIGVEPLKINSSLVSAQNRPRLYWTNIPSIEYPEDKGVLLKHIIQRDICEKFYLSEKAIARIKRSKFGRKYDTIDTYKTGTLIAGYYKIPTDGIYFDDGLRKRRYTPTECESLQTVPKGYTRLASDCQRYKMLGNGWTVDVIAHIFKSLKEKLCKT